MKTGKIGIEIVKEFEKLFLTVYICPAGGPTIGWGHLIKKGEEFKTITETEADTILAQDLKIAENAVTSLVTVPISQWQYDALVSFTFNVGRGRPDRPGFEQSTLLKCLNKKLYALAAKEFDRWNRGGGQVLAGLTARRRCEKIIFRAGTEQKEGV